ncbi:carbohydrate-binding domain family 9-like protein [Rhodotorula toruloides]|uniref:Carbohydrate-binding domain family 9-like protein n=1 Tax=Rhodotorula toruloides TaxID=5286 RepID=A0A511KCX3_RHOTO|nr:carbohydrate-binding domain family 9-like protein [Rhodotorula toruloides]
MLLLAATVVALAVPLAVALSGHEVAAVFPSSSSSLKGGKIALPRFDLSIISNGTYALYVANASSTSPTSVGWLGVGHGTAMADADFLLAWPTVSGSSVNWTLSHRLPNSDTPGAHGMPVLASSGAGTSTGAFYTLVPALTTSDSSSPFSSVAFTRLVDPGPSYPTAQGVTNTTLGSGAVDLIYASSSRNPGSANEGQASIGMHNQPTGVASLDLSAPYVLAANESSTPPPQTQQAPPPNAAARRRRRIFIAHAALGGLAFAIFIPLAIITARFGRERFAWLPPHAALQILAASMTIVTFALAVSQTGNLFEDSHQRLGLVLLLLVILQLLVGYLAHITLPSALTSSSPSFSRPRPSPARAIHILLGLTILALGWVQVHTGIKKGGEWYRATLGTEEVPRAVRGVFWTLVGLFVLAYLGEWVASIRRGVTGKNKVAANGEALPLRDAGEGGRKRTRQT